MATWSAVSIAENINYRTWTLASSILPLVKGFMKFVCSSFSGMHRIGSSLLIGNAIPVLLLS